LCYHAANFRGNGALWQIERSGVAQRLGQYATPAGHAGVSTAVGGYGRLDKNGALYQVSVTTDKFPGGADVIVRRRLR
jgi:hypothetical protein